MTTQPTEPVLACNISAIPRELRKSHQANIERIRAHVQEVREEETGYAVRLPNETELLQTVVAFLSYERLCCPFLHFRLDIHPEQGPIWLSMTSSVDVKSFLESEGLVPDDSVLPSERKDLEGERS